MTALALRPAFATTRSVVMLLALYGAIAVYLYEKSSGPFDSPIEGYATVIDGDTLSISGKRIRLLNIDAPEIDQTCGEDRSKLWFCGESASDEMKKHLAGQKVRCELRGYDHYRRLLGLCALPDSSEINAWAVREGWAVAYGLGDTYKKEEAEASRAQHGIWSSQFIRPSLWREQGPHDNKLYEGD